MKGIIDKKHHIAPSSPFLTTFSLNIVPINTIKNNHISDNFHAFVNNAGNIIRIIGMLVYPNSVLNL